MSEDMESRDHAPAGGAALDGFKVGDRVRLRRDRADGWLLPWRKFALEGRSATITSFGGLAQRHAWCEFDVKRSNARPQRMDFHPRELELVSSAKPAERD